MTENTTLQIPWTMKKRILIPVLLFLSLLYGCVNDCSFGACADYETCVEGSCIGPCDTVSCENGNCQSNTGECSCDPYWEGDRCEKGARDKFIGTYLRESSDCSQLPDYYISVSEIPGFPRRLSLRGLYNTTDSTQTSSTVPPLEARIDQNDYTVLFLDRQSFDLSGSDIITISGTASMYQQAGVLSIYYRVHYFNQPDIVCNEEFKKL